MKPIMGDAELKHRKKLQGNISIAGGTLGLTALAAKGGSVALAGGKVGRLMKLPAHPARSTQLKDLSTGLTTVGAGIGGAGAYNFAAYTKAESRKRTRTPTVVGKSYGGMMDFGLDSVNQGDASRLEEISKKKSDWQNISEHQRRAKDSRDVKRSATSVAGFGGSAVVGSVAARQAFHPNSPDTFTQAGNVGRQVKASFGAVKATKGRSAGINRAAMGGIKAASVKNPYGAAALGGAALIAGGGATAVGARMNEGRHNKAIGQLRRKRAVAKAYDPEANRQKRLDHYATATNIAAGAAGTGAAVQTKRAIKGGVHKLPSNPVFGRGVRSAGKAGALGLGAVGAVVASDRIKNYKSSPKNRRYKPMTVGY